MQSFVLKVKNQEPNITLTAFFQSMLENNLVDALLLPQELSSHTAVVHTLVKKPESIVSADLAAPVSLGNTARLVSDLTFTSHEEKVGVVLRPCELQAVIELAKLRQVKLESLVLIGIDCLGTFEPREYCQMIEKGELKTGQWMQLVNSRENLSVTDFGLRKACQICDRICVENVQLSIGWVGVDVDKFLLISIEDSLAPMFKEKLDLEESSDHVEQNDFLRKLQVSKKAAREDILADFYKRVNNIDALLAELSTCLKCQNCRRVCPLCFCRRCVFESELFEHDSSHYLNRAQRKGLIKMPTDTLLFHLTRLVHMGMSCVGCGHCESACPSKLPLSIIFPALASSIQELFDYLPGKDLAEELPVVVFKEVELEPR